MSKLIPIQVLRAVAALAVVLFHTQYEAGFLAAGAARTFQPDRTLPWEAGVDVFFVISGFVMVFASAPLFGRAGGRAMFLSRRILRVVPLYWLTTTAYLALALLGGGLVKGQAEPGYVLASYAFYPVARPDGVMAPFYSLGWTLNYEMAFYALFALALGLRRRPAVMAVLAMLCGLVAATRLLALPQPVAFWGDPIVLEFGFGVVLGWLRAEGVTLGIGPRLALGVLGVALFAVVSGGVTPGEIAPADPALHRALSFGVPAACLVAACGLARAQPAEAESRLVQLGSLLGDASYALYLTHPFVIRALRQILQASGLAPAVPFWLFVAVALLASVLASVAVFRVVERPLGRLLRPRLDRIWRLQAA
jgi:exopolysaccharide production protein ExoZ